MRSPCGQGRAYETRRWRRTSCGDFGPREPSKNDREQETWIGRELRARSCRFDKASCRACFPVSAKAEGAYRRPMERQRELYRRASGGLREHPGRRLAVAKIVGSHMMGDMARERTAAGYRSWAIGARQAMVKVKERQNGTGLIVHGREARNNRKMKRPQKKGAKRE